MSGARQVSRDEDVTAVIQLAGLPVDRQIPKDRLRRQLLIVRERGLGSGADCGDDGGTHPLDSLADLGEIALEALFVVTHVRT